MIPIGPAQRLSTGTICRRLRTIYGPVSAPPQEPVLDELIATILSQNTSDPNSSAAFAELQRRFPNWDAVRRAPVRSVAAAIRRAGLANRKAPRIQAILDEIHRQRGELNLDHLRSVPTRTAKAYLAQFHGVGKKTVACVLLFACGKPVLPVDTHVHRVCRRLGLIGPATDANRAHEQLARQVRPQYVLEFHVQLVRHGRRTCSAANPKCPSCVLLDGCPEGVRRVQL